MATVKAVLNTRPNAQNKDGSYPIIIRIRDGNKVRELPTKKKIQEKYWTGSEVSKKHPDAAIINSAISSMISEAKNFIATAQLQKKPLRIELIGKERDSFSFNEFLQHKRKQYVQKEQHVIARKVNRFDLDLKDCFKRELYFDDLNADLLHEFESYLIKKENVNNTRHKKFKFLQELYTQAVEAGKANLPNPFKAYKIAKKPVKKDKLTKEEIARIESLELQPGAVNDARNLFLFSYYCKGMRFENCLTVKHSDIKNDRIYFRSNKGNKFISVKLHTRLKEIIDQYQCEEFIFPFITSLPETKLKYMELISSKNVVINRNLKTVAGLAEINLNLTFHIARHSLAFHLMEHASIHVIKETLGHSDYRTTEIYLKELGDTVIDRDMDKLYGQ